MKQRRQDTDLLISGTLCEMSKLHSSYTQDIAEVFSRRPSQTLSSTAGISGEASDQIFFSLTIIIATFNVVITGSFSRQALKILLSTEREPTYMDGWERSFSPNLKENIFPREDWGRSLTC